MKKAAQGRYFRAFQALIGPNDSRYGAADETLIPRALLVFLHEGDFPAMGYRNQYRPRVAREHHAGLRSGPCYFSDITDHWLINLVLASHHFWTA